MRQSLRTWSSVLDVSCANRFYSKAAVPGCSRGCHSLEHKPLAAAHVPAPCSSMEQGLWWLPRVFGVSHLGCSSSFLFSHYFHNSCGSLRRGASPSERWLFVHQRHYKHARRTYLIFLLSFFNDKLGSVYPLSSRHKGAGVPQTVTSKK